MTYRIYSPSIAKKTIHLETLDQLIDTLTLDGVLYLAESEAVLINQQLSYETEKDTGLSSLDGSTRLNDNTLAYFGHNMTPVKGEGYDFIIKQHDTLDVTTLSIHLKGSFIFNRVLTSLVDGGRDIDTKELYTLERQDRAEEVYNDLDAKEIEEGRKYDECK